MQYRDWIITRKEIPIIPTRWVWVPYPRRVPVLLEARPIVYWLLLKDVVWDIHYAPYIVSTYLDIQPSQVVTMQAGRVIALFNHIKSQVGKCNRAYQSTQDVLLPLSDGVDNSHFENLDRLVILHDLMSNGGKTLMECEQMIFSHAISYLMIKNAYIRSEQNRYLKNKPKSQ